MNASTVNSLFATAERKALKKKCAGPEQILTAVERSEEVASVRRALDAQTWKLIWRSYAKRIRSHTPPETEEGD